MEDVRPTAKWAHRILRPLTSIHHRLEKHQEIVSIITANAKYKEKLEARHNAESSIPHKPVEIEDNTSDCDADGDDPAWVPGQRVKRRIRHKYSMRGEVNGPRRRNRLSIASPEVHKTLPGAIEMATPLITGKSMRVFPSARKSLSQTMSDPPEQPRLNDARKRPRTKNTNHLFTYKGSWKEALDLSGDTGLADIARFLNRIFLKFLSSTRLHVNGSSLRRDRGTRSLLSMAVRRLPKFIADEQRAQDEEDEDNDVDMCDAYFTELEAHYASSGNGWQPLREAVRAQGIHLVSEMLQRKWVTNLVACRLLKDCMHQSELDAFETLLSNYLLTVSTYDYPMSFESSKPSDDCDDPVQLLNTYYSELPSRQSFVFSELAKLLLRKAIPPEWMVTTAWKKCVDGAIVSLSAEDDDSAAATTLIEAVILSASCSFPSLEASSHGTSMTSLHPVCQRDTRASATNESSSSKGQPPCPIPIQDALSNLISSLIAVLCGMYMVRSYAPVTEEPIVNMRMRDIVGSLALTVQRSIEVRPLSLGTDIPTFQSLRRGCVLLGNCLLRCGEVSLLGAISPSDSGSTQQMEAFFLSLASQQDMVKELATLVRQVIHCCERVNKCDQTYVSREIRSKVSKLLEVDSTRGLSMFLGKVAVEAAMEFAEKTLDSEDHVWAAEVQERAASSQHRLNRKASITSEMDLVEESAGLYRWEESIGEWVARTPVAKVKVTPFDLSSKPSAANRKLPSVIACSTQDSTGSSDESDDSSSSITSLAPSLSMKRPPQTSDPTHRPNKRLRSVQANPGPVRRSARQRLADLRNSGSASDSTLSSTTANDRSRRMALREMRQAMNLPSYAVTREKNPILAATKIEVVIMNKKGPHSHDRLTEDVQESVKGCGLRKQEPLVEVPPRSPVKAFAFPVRPARTVIPCSQDDESDDELSFL